MSSVWSRLEMSSVVCSVMQYVVCVTRYIRCVTKYNGPSRTALRCYTPAYGIAHCTGGGGGGLWTWTVDVDEMHDALRTTGRQEAKEKEEGRQCGWSLIPIQAPSTQPDLPPHPRKGPGSPPRAPRGAGAPPGSTPSRHSHCSRRRWGRGSGPAQRAGRWAG
jgi:hypothetical protein